MKHLRFTRFLVPLILACALPPPVAAVEIPNGGSVKGSLSPGQLVGYTFPATAGDIANIRVADINNTILHPLIYLYAPDGTLLGADQGPTVARLLNIALPQSGPYRVVLQDYYRIGGGDYELHLARAPGANEGGRLLDGDARLANLTVGDLDSYTFFARASDSLFFSMTDLTESGELSPYFVVYAPDGTGVTSHLGPTVASRSNIELPLTGIYTVVATDYRSGFVSGDYRINFQLIRSGQAADCLVEDARNQYTLADNTYALLSLPCLPPAGTTIGDLFGDDIAGEFGEDWAVFTFDAARIPQPGYVRETADGTLRPGQGFWIVQATGAEVILDLPAGSQRVQPEDTENPACTGADGCRSVALTGAPHPVMPDTGEPKLNLWNLLGNPASGTEIPVAGNNLRITTGTGTCVASEGGCTLDQALAADVASNVIFTYDGPPAYTRLGSADTLGPWQGFWIAERSVAVGNSPTVLFPAN